MYIEIISGKSLQYKQLSYYENIIIVITIILPKANSDRSS